MEIYQLQVFLEVARCLSFTEAADALNLTQPAVSAKIKSLETELKTPLFYRLGRKVQLTEVGDLLSTEGVKLVELEKSVRSRIENFKQGDSGTLSIGCSPAISITWLPQLIYRYRQVYPGIHTELKIFQSGEQLYKAITDQQVDLAFSELEFENFAEISVSPIARITHSTVVSSNHSLANQDWLSLQDLIDHPLVLLNDKFPSRILFNNRIAEFNLAPEDFLQLETVDTLGLMRTYITQGDYLGFGSSLEFGSECEAGILKAIPLQEFPFPTQLFLLLESRHAKLLLTQSELGRKLPTLSSPTQKFISLIQSNLNQAKRSLENVENSFELKTPEYLTLRSPKFSLHKSNNHKLEALPLSIGVQNGTIPTVTAGLIIQKLGLLEHFLPQSKQYNAVQYQISWQDFSLGTPIAEALKSGMLDIGILGDYPLLQAADLDETFLVSFVAINPDGCGNAVLVPAASEVNAIEDLRGKSVAIPLGSSAHGMMLRALNRLDLLTEVQLSPMNSVGDRVSNAQQQMAGYAHFSPFHQIAYDRGNVRYLFKGNLCELPSFYGVVVRRKFAEQHPEVVVAYLQALQAAQSWYQHHNPLAFSMISQWTKVHPRVLEEILCPNSKPSNRDRTSGFFVQDLTIRRDWLESHIQELQSVPENRHLQEIELNQWIQSEFLQLATAG
ncbi:MAG: LysR family transcriptional regulator [Microcoleaceae cyanobacterium]